MKHTDIDGYTVGCFIAVKRGLTDEEAKDEAEEVRVLIKRHVLPHNRHIRETFIEPQLRETCEHCGGLWFEKSDTYNGGCCDNDEKANPANKSEAA